jgi:hypothetical protein
MILLSLLLALGPPPEPAYQNNARVRALMVWADEAWSEIQQLRQRDAQRMRVRFILDDWRGRESDYTILFLPDLPVEPQPVVYSATDYATWHGIDGSEWRSFGAPRPSGEGIGWFAPGNWVEFPASQGRSVVLSMANPSSGAQVSVNGVVVDVPNTGAWDVFVDVVVPVEVDGPVRVAGHRASAGYWVGDLKSVRVQP